jgi:tetratricopeptide (TPR) repeat protein
MRLYDDTGDLWRAYGAFAQLAERRPRLCERVMPRRIPRWDSKVCRQITADIDKRLAGPLTADLAAALRRFRTAIMGTQAVALRPAPPYVPPPAASTKPPREHRQDAVIESARRALAEGDLDAAQRALSQSRTANPARPSLDALLVQAQLEMARGNVRRAGLAAMTVVTDYPDAPQAAEALIIAGDTMQRLGRREKAADLFRRAADHARASPDTKRRAQERIAALPPMPLRPAAPTPTTGDPGATP